MPIIQNQLPQNQGDTRNVASYDPARLELDENMDTVAGRINSVIDRNSPLMQQAQTAARQDAASRGLVNSSMAVQAGQMATYNAALPIAQQDAQQSYDARRTDVANRNQALQFGASGMQDLQRQDAATDSQSRLQGEQGDISSRLQGQQGDIQSRLQGEQGDIQSRLQGQQGDIQGRLQDQQGDIASRLQTERAQIDQELLTADFAGRESLLARQAEIDLVQQVLRHEQAQELTQLEGRWRQLLEASNNATQQFTAVAVSISTILANPDIPANQKQALIDHEIRLLNYGLTFLGSLNNIDVSDLIENPATPTQPDLSDLDVGLR